MADALTQKDVERLLKPTVSQSHKQANLADTGGIDLALGFEAKSRGKSEASSSATPSQLNDDQREALRSLHEEVSRKFATALSALVRNPVTVKLIGVEQMSHAQFIRTLDKPTCLNLLKIDALDASWILELSPAIVFPMIDRLLGGGREPAPLLRRPLTEIELRLMARVVGLFLEEFRRVWRDVIDLSIVVDRVESDPEVVQIVSGSEAVMATKFEITIGRSQGPISLCMPVDSIQRIGQMLVARGSAVDDAEGASDRANHIGQKLRGDSVELVAQLDESKISTEDLVGLRVGDMIATDHSADTPILVSLGGASKFRARLGAVAGLKAIRIDESVTSAAPPVHSNNAAEAPATPRTEK
jgi:flagellar motor switch protein FliM